jgi:hypothetical protein
MDDSTCACVSRPVIVLVFVFLLERHRRNKMSSSSVPVVIPRGFHVTQQLPWRFRQKTCERYPMF